MRCAAAGLIRESKKSAQKADSTGFLEHAAIQNAGFAVRNAFVTRCRRLSGRIECA
jgi:hypothetical protein